MTALSGHGEPPWLVRVPLKIMSIMNPESKNEKTKKTRKKNKTTNAFRWRGLASRATREHRT
jgi:hypothetical protein